MLGRTGAVALVGAAVMMRTAGAEPIATEWYAGARPPGAAV